jgi:hypothetical protein
MPSLRLEGKSAAIPIGADSPLSAARSNGHDLLISLFQIPNQWQKKWRRHSFACVLLCLRTKR